MSRPREPRPAKLLVSCLTAEPDRLWPEVLAALEDLFGPAELVYPALPFDHTAYYNDELGTPIVRRLAAFARPYPLDGLVAAKLATNALEDRLARADGSRRVNLDPGLVTCERLVLATGKNFTHRVYLAQGIFADLTLVFQGGSWQILPWTFPDYAAPEMLAILTDIRARCRRDLREGAVLHPFSKELPCPRA